MRFLSSIAIITVLLTAISCDNKIDRESLFTRNSPHVTELDCLSSLSVGNGGFAFTADCTGMQSFPEIYTHGIPLGTMSHWGWHSFPNTHGYTLEDCLAEEDFGRGHPESYALQGSPAADYVRSNPHRIHLGNIGFADLNPDNITDIDQTLNIWDGLLHSNFTYEGTPVSVITNADPTLDAVCFDITTKAHLPVAITFPYPTGAHTDDACDWNANDKHTTTLLRQSSQSSHNNTLTILKRQLDSTSYYVTILTNGATLQLANKDSNNTHCSNSTNNTINITPESDHWFLSVLFTPDIPEEDTIPTPKASQKATKGYWHNYWNTGAVVDFSGSTDKRAAELERRVVLSQYLTAIQCAAPTPPAETGLTYNSWFGKFHLEMTWWHEAHFALWGHPEMLERTMPWYLETQNKAKEIAQRQGFNGIRWMKMTDPSGNDTASDIGTYLIWQQPHVIYLTELLKRAGRPVDQYADLIEETANFMTDFLVYDNDQDRYILKGCIPAQETLRPHTTVNPPFELAYWNFGLNIAQQWHYDADRQTKIDKLSHLAEKDGLYLAAESEPDTYSSVALTSDHMAVLAAYGMLPNSDLFDEDTMRNTLNWVMNNWHWDHTWGWDFALTAMCATRLGCPETALDALLMDTPTNTYLVNGHNWQNDNLRCYLPGNGSLLTAVALMCTASASGSTSTSPHKTRYTTCPGFPTDGTWTVRWSGLHPLP